MKIKLSVKKNQEVPVITMLKVMPETPRAVGETVKVRFAEVTILAPRTKPSLSQVTVKYAVAFAGFQLFVVIFKVTETVPLFFMYPPKLFELFGSIIPQLMLVTGFVQLLSENTPTPMAATPAMLERLLVEINLAYTYNPKISAITATVTNAIIVVLFILRTSCLREKSVLS
jgi:hypothetical protein